MMYLNAAVGIICNAQQEIFITRPAADVNIANFWEFSGSKIEQDETPKQALNRELREETGIEIKQLTLLKVLGHCFSDRILMLHFYLVEG